MTIQRAACVAFLSLLAGVGCGSKKVWVPPRLELAPIGRVGLVTFTIENAKGTLHEFATQRFAEQMLAAQTGFEVMELGESERLVEEVGASRLDGAAIRAIGDAHGLPALFLGHVAVSNVKPRASLAQLPRIGAEVTVSLSVRLVSTESGGTIWRSSARATETIAELALSGDEPFFAAQDPDEAYGHLVDHLVYEVTRDLRPTYRKR